MYALDAKTGKIVWEFYMVPKTEGEVARGPIGQSPLDMSTLEKCSRDTHHGRGNVDVLHVGSRDGPPLCPVGNPGARFRASTSARAPIYLPVRFSCWTPKPGPTKTISRLVPMDWHDWDVSNTPTLIHTQGGKHLLAVAPKDGYLYGIDLATNTVLYRTPVTQNEECRCPLLGRQSRPFLPRFHGRRRMEWGGLRSADQPYSDRRGRLVHTVTLQTQKTTSGDCSRQAMEREASMQPL